jgi:hypothetical protein
MDMMNARARAKKRVGIEAKRTTVEKERDPGNHVVQVSLSKGSALARSGTHPHSLFL